MVTKITGKKKSITAKRKTTTKTRASASATGYKTFRIQSDAPSFFKPRVTKQTVYWSVLLLFIIIMQLVIISMSVNASLSLDGVHFF
jgi:GTPase Era involved in 16S rRNA processing